MTLAIVTMEMLSAACRCAFGRDRPPIGAGPACVLVLVSALWSVGGCGGSAQPRGTAAGTVTIDGEPLGGGTIVFENVSSGLAVTGGIAQDGSYTMRTHQGDGLPVGSYRIAVTPQIVAATDENPLASESLIASSPSPSTVIPLEYQSTTSSALRVQVNEGRNPPFNFDLAPSS